MQPRAYFLAYARSTSQDPCDLEDFSNNDFFDDEHAQIIKTI